MYPTTRSNETLISKGLRLRLVTAFLLFRFE